MRLELATTFCLEQGLQAITPVNFFGSLFDKILFAAFTLWSLALRLACLARDLERTQDVFALHFIF